MRLLQTRSKCSRLLGILTVGQVREEDQIATVADVVTVVADDQCLVLSDASHSLAVVYSIGRENVSSEDYLSINVARQVGR